MLNLPLSYLLLKVGFGAEIVVIIALVIEIIALLVRIFMLRSTIPQFNPFNFLTRIIANCISVAIIPVLLIYLLDLFIKHSMMIDLLLMVLCSVSCLISILTIGCTKTERLYVVDKTQNIIKKLRR